MDRRDGFDSSGSSLSPSMAMQAANANIEQVVNAIVSQLNSFVSVGAVTPYESGLVVDRLWARWHQMSSSTSLPSAFPDASPQSSGSSKRMGSGSMNSEQTQSKRIPLPRFKPPSQLRSNHPYDSEEANSLLRQKNPGHARPETMRSVSRQSKEDASLLGSARSYGRPVSRSTTIRDMDLIQFDDQPSQHTIPPREPRGKPSEHDAPLDYALVDQPERDHKMQHSSRPESVQENDADEDDEAEVLDMPTQSRPHGSAYRRLSQLPRPEFRVPMTAEAIRNQQYRDIGIIPHDRLDAWELAHLTAESAAIYKAHYEGRRLQLPTVQREERHGNEDALLDRNNDDPVLNSHNVPDPASSPSTLSQESTWSPGTRMQLKLDARARRAAVKAGSIFATAAELDSPSSGVSSPLTERPSTISQILHPDSQASSIPASQIPTGSASQTSPTARQNPWSRADVPAKRIQPLNNSVGGSIRTVPRPAPPGSGEMICPFWLTRSRMCTKECSRGLAHHIVPGAPQERLECFFWHTTGFCAKEGLNQPCVGEHYDTWHGCVYPVPGRGPWSRRGARERKAFDFEAPASSAGSTDASSSKVDIEMMQDPQQTLQKELPQGLLQGKMQEPLQTWRQASPQGPPKEPPQVLKREGHNVQQIPPQESPQTTKQELQKGIPQETQDQPALKTGEDGIKTLTHSIWATKSEPGSWADMVEQEDQEQHEQETATQTNGLQSNDLQVKGMTAAKREPVHKAHAPPKGRTLPKGSRIEQYERAGWTSPDFWQEAGPAAAAQDNQRVAARDLSVLRGKKEPPREPAAMRSNMGGLPQEFEVQKEKNTKDRRRERRAAGTIELRGGGLDYSNSKARIQVKSKVDGEVMIGVEHEVKKEVRVEEKKEATTKLSEAKLAELKVQNHKDDVTSSSLAETTEEMEPLVEENFWAEEEANGYSWGQHGWDDTNVGINAARRAW